jgi:hypothetical protein
MSGLSFVQARVEQPYQRELLCSIFQHRNVVSALEVLVSRKVFLSGGYDGLLNLYDLDQIEK